jgi:hypothetical protein
MKATRKFERRVSDYFGIRKSQTELDFVDVPVVGDVTLFLDPYAFTLGREPWFQECNDLVVDFFAQLIESIRHGRSAAAEKLVSNLHEPTDTHLGFASTTRGGRGIGRHQARDLLVALAASRAVQTGSLDDISDCELLIPGISADKVSDITTNVVRGKLIEYTQAQCALYDIPTRPIAGGVYWSIEDHFWKNAYASLPVVKSQRLVLIPKACVRFRPTITAQEFYDDFVLKFLEAEHIDANDSLVYVLKNGSKRVLKRDLKSKHPFSKEMLFEFIQEHPDVLQKYKERARNTSQPLRNGDLEWAHRQSRDTDPTPLIKQLQEIPPGNEHAGKFHNLILGILSTLFYPALTFPQKEQEINEGRKRIDISFNNGAREGFFESLRSNYQVFSPFIFFECKNYKSDPQNPELDQLVGRFSDKRGQFGVIVCRQVNDKPLMLKRCKDALNDKGAYVFVFDDDDITKLLKLSAEQKQSEIDRFMTDQMRALVM